MDLTWEEILLKEREFNSTLTLKQEFFLRLGILGEIPFLKSYIGMFIYCKIWT